jgi:class 3 adenylate cyclase/tetratricopeptide (TPR) repeat protein
MPACARCGEPNPDGARFCSSCGAELGAGTDAREERKVVSVLFVDLVGFTSQSDRADPEDVREMLETYHRVVKEQIERFGGAVEKFIGDAVMAVFGAPVAHTDDAERAVRAGLRALEALRELGDGDGPRLTARAAVNTGEAVVAVGQHVPGEPLAIGDVVNTASRLQTSAPPDRLVVGEETHRATRDAIRYEGLDPVIVKGKHEPLLLWVAVEPMAATGERRMRDTPMVGRARELSLLESVWERATAERRPHLVTVLGPPGIGKTRLSREFARLVEEQGARVMRGRCLPYDNRDVFGAFAQQVKTMARILESEAPSVAREKLADAVAAVVPEAERVDLVRSLSLLLGLGLDPPAEDQMFLLFSARRLVEHLGAERPTLLVFEDIHWADAGQLDLIEYMAGRAVDSPVVFLALARPELVDARPAWGSGSLGHSTISLDPVSTEDAGAIVAGLAGGDLPAHSVERLVEVAEGNPLFLEELTAALAEGADPVEELPTTVRAAIAGRVDALPPEHRSALLAASVVGKVFWLGALKALGLPGDLERVLDDMEGRDLVRREPTSRVGGDVEFVFKHMLIRDVCYATLPRAERRNTHAAVARYVEQVAGGQERELAWLLAHHWEEAGEAEPAVRSLLLAADRAQEAMAQDEAMELFDRAARLAGDDATRLRIRLLRALARERLEDFERAYAELRDLIPLLEGRDRVEALLAMARSSHWTERTADAIESAGRAQELARTIGARDLVAPATARLSQGHAMRGEPGDLERALELGEQALADWIAGVRPGDLAEHQHLLANPYYWTGRYDRAYELSSAARDTAVDPTSVEALLRGGGIMGLSLTGAGRYEEALESFDAVIAAGRELGWPTKTSLNYSTALFRELGDYDEARRRSEDSMSQASRNPSFHMPWMNAIVDLIHTDVLEGEHGAALTRWDGIWDEILETPAWERWLLAGKLAAFRAEIALATEGPSEAAAWATRAVEMARSVGRVKYEAVARATLGKAQLALGERDDAVRELRTAVAAADSLANPVGRWRARADLARVLVAIGDDDGAAEATRAAAAIIHDVAAGLSDERRRRFVESRDASAVLNAAG